MASSARSNGKTVVVALSGNAILHPGRVGTLEKQLFHGDLDAVIASLVDVAPALQGTAGTRLVGAPVKAGAAGPSTIVLEP